MSSQQPTIQTLLAHQFPNLHNSVHSRTVSNSQHQIYQTQYAFPNQKAMNAYGASHSREQKEASQSQILSQTRRTKNSQQNRQENLSKDGKQMQNYLSMQKSHQKNNQSINQVQVLQGGQGHSQLKKDKNFSTSDLHGGGLQKQQDHIQNKLVQSQAPKQNDKKMPPSNKRIPNELKQQLADEELRKDNIQKAIDNLKTFIKGSFPASALQQKISQQKQLNNYQRPKGKNINAFQTQDNVKGQLGVPRELSEDPRQQLFSSQMNRQQQNIEKVFGQFQQDDVFEDSLNNSSIMEAYEDSNQRRNPHEPIPAFTSIDVAKKLRYRSEERYINERMEKELIAYKGEIEKRFQKSKLKDFKFPRIRKSPQFFDHVGPPRDRRDKEPNYQILIDQDSSKKCSPPAFKEGHHANKENLKGCYQVEQAKGAILDNGSPKSPLLITNKQSGPTFDYKKVLSQFLSTSGAKYANMNLNQPQETSSPKSGHVGQGSMLSQKVLYNAKTHINDKVSKKGQNAGSGTHKKYTSTFVDQSTNGITAEHRETDISRDAYKGRVQLTDGDRDDMVPVRVEEFQESEPSCQVIASTKHMKTFDHCSKQSMNSIGSKSVKQGCDYGAKGFQTSANQITQKMRRDLMSEGVIKKHNKPGNDRQSNIEKNCEGKHPKNLSKNSEYFKTFCNKGAGSKGNRNTINATNSGASGGIDGNPFASFQSKENSSSQKKQAQIGKYSGITVSNPFPSQMALKAMMNENQTNSTRNNQLNNGGQSVHIRAKTTSDFDQLSSNTKLKMLKAALADNEYQIPVSNNEQKPSECFVLAEISSGQSTNANSIKSSFFTGNQRNKKSKKGKKNESQGKMPFKEEKPLPQSKCSNNDLMKSLKLTKNPWSECPATINSGNCTERANPYVQPSKNTQQLLYSHREHQRHATRTQSGTGTELYQTSGLTGLDSRYQQNPYIDQLKQTCSASNQALHEKNTTSSRSLKQIYSSFQNQCGSSSSSMSKKKQTSNSNLGRSSSKRNFAIKRMQIDLSKKNKEIISEQY